MSFLFNLALLQSLQTIANVAPGQTMPSAGTPISKSYWRRGLFKRHPCTPELRSSNFHRRQIAICKGLFGILGERVILKQALSPSRILHLRKLASDRVLSNLELDELRRSFNRYSVFTQGVHRFSFVLVLGRKLDFNIDRNTFASYNIGNAMSSASYPLFALAEEGYFSVAPFAFSPVTFKAALQVKSGVWSDVFRYFIRGFGIQGRVQNSTLLANELVVGSNLNIVPSSSQLWP